MSNEWQSTTGLLIDGRGIGSSRSRKSTKNRKSDKSVEYRISEKRRIHPHLNIVGILENRQMLDEELIRFRFWVEGEYQPRISYHFCSFLSYQPFRSF